MKNNKKIKVFFALQFSDSKISKTDKENALVEAISDSEKEIVKKYPEYQIEWTEWPLDTGKQIGEQILDLISSCDIFIADLSDYNYNVLFELGVAYGLQKTLHKKIIWLIHESVDFSQIPSDIKGLYIEKYNKQSLRPRLTRMIRDASSEITTLRRESAGLSESTDILRHFWKFQ